MSEWLGSYNTTVGMYNVAIITTIFGAFIVAFTVAIAWPKLVEDFGPAGGMLAAGIIVGTFWVMNHKLPGFGINPEGIKDAAGNLKQFGLIHQGFRGGAPWIDMGWAIAVGLWVCSLMESKRGERLAQARESLPRLAVVLLGGAFGGAVVGLTGFTNANLFG